MMMREEKLESFLVASGWGNAKRAPLAGDASNRRYERLSKDDGAPAVLMDAPPEKGEDVRPFVHIAQFLSGIGLSAPKIFATDEASGFLLLEDLGDSLFARVLSSNPELEEPLYAAATDVLLALHSETPPDLTTYDPKIMTKMAGLAYHWYANEANTAPTAAAFEPVFEALLSQEITDYSVLIQRDYHAENLLWLPEREGVAKVGLLDFQDAMLGHPAYDLVSLLQDARRDVSMQVEAQMIARYAKARALDLERFNTAYALLGVQRNLRILGVFARLCLLAGKAHYIDLIPRVWGYLERDLAHPALSSIREMILAEIPAPSQKRLNRLKQKCGTIPKL